MISHALAALILPLASFAHGQSCPVDDAFEPNDSVCAPAAMSVGVFADLRVAATDPDVYRFTPAPGFQGTFAVEFQNAAADLDLFAYIAAAGQTCGFGAPVLSSTAGAGIEEIRAFALSPGDSWILEVRSGATGCTSYDLTVAETPVATIGDTVCFQQPNSSGFPAEILVLGSRGAAANDVTLRVAGLPFGEFGIFVVSRGFGVVQNPGGSDGDLCIAGGPIGRYVGPGQVLLSDDFGNVTMPLDLTSTPQGSALVPIQAGETWFFQYWTRDVLSSHYSSAARVRFE